MNQPSESNDDRVVEKKPDDDIPWNVIVEAVEDDQGDEDDDDENDSL